MQSRLNSPFLVLRVIAVWIEIQGLIQGTSLSDSRTSVFRGGGMWIRALPAYEVFFARGFVAGFSGASAAAVPS